jgi:hypothetical protein
MPGGVSRMPRSVVSFGSQFYYEAAPERVQRDTRPAADEWARKRFCVDSGGGAEKFQRISGRNATVRERVGRRSLETRSLTVAFPSRML